MAVQRSTDATITFEDMLSELQTHTSQEHEAPTPKKAPGSMPMDASPGGELLRTRRTKVLTKTFNGRASARILDPIFDQALTPEKVVVGASPLSQSPNSLRKKGYVKQMFKLHDRPADDCVKSGTPTHAAKSTDGTAVQTGMKPFQQFLDLAHKAKRVVSSAAKGRAAASSLARQSAARLLEIYSTPTTTRQKRGHQETALEEEAASTPARGPAAKAERDPSTPLSKSRRITSKTSPQLVKGSWQSSSFPCVD